MTVPDSPMDHLDGEEYDNDIEDNDGDDNSEGHQYGNQKHKIIP